MRSLLPLLTLPLLTLPLLTLPLLTLPLLTLPLLTLPLLTLPLLTLPLLTSAAATVPTTAPRARALEVGVDTGPLDAKVAVQRCPDHCSATTTEACTVTETETTTCFETVTETAAGGTLTLPPVTQTQPGVTVTGTAAGGTVTETETTTCLETVTETGVGGTVTTTKTETEHKTKTKTVVVPTTVVDEETATITATCIEIHIITSVETDSYAVTATHTYEVTQTSVTTCTQVITLPPVTYTTTIAGAITTVTEPDVVTTIITTAYLTEINTVRDTNTVHETNTIHETDTVHQTDTVHETDIETKTDVVTRTISAPVITTTLPGVVTSISGTPITLPGIVTTITASVSYIGTRVSTCAVPAPTIRNVKPQPDNYTWGCPPGRICAPRHPFGCDVFADPPSRNYVCDPLDCFDAPKAKLVEWKYGETGYYPLTPGYFALSPLAFGLSYDIFSEDVVVEVVNGVPVATITTGNWASQATITAAYTVPALRRRAPETAPAICFPQCNNIVTAGQAIGKTPALCAAGSAFLNYVSACKQCVVNNGDATQKTLQDYVIPQYQQWIDFCDAHGSESVVAPGGGQGQNGGGDVTILAPGETQGGDAVPVTPTRWMNSTMTMSSSRVPTSTIEEPGTTETGASTDVPSDVPTGTTSSGGRGRGGGVAGPTGSGGGPTPTPTVPAIPNEALRVGGGVGGMLALVVFVIGFVMFG
ncbi:hypothetical protein VC83_02063 [Pseudogymnoascus destructans]|uniref:Glycoprotein X n=2 Tax=Pseudogymnoascus destructans TaxID=655981 RepID=L8FWP4_PSED2|nr:uncharacterized protein VC83_02063 [Pseudogymnoascus destructans]ELR04141.1 hypothetical protein GMDG_01445 [Pseudogymnoascus destructans 20631-21]OAF61390.2 hypothetical protein VC83_02063 [Pseudogymnoascus destructans]